MSNRPTRLVLVTNDSARASVVEQVSATHGWQVLPCVRRPIPFELLDHLRIDLFLVDLDLENALEQLRTLAKRPGAKLIAMASPERMGGWHEAFQAGAKELVSLPLDPNHLVATINHLVNGSPTAAPNTVPSAVHNHYGEPQRVKEHGSPAVKETVSYSDAAKNARIATDNPLSKNGQAEAFPPSPVAHGALPPRIPHQPTPQSPMTNYVGSSHPNVLGSTPASFIPGGASNRANPHPAAGQPDSMFANHNPSGMAHNAPYPANGHPTQGYPQIPPSRFIAVTGLRGGVGRSTIASNLAVALRQRLNANVILAEAHHGLGHLALMLNMLPRHTLASLTEGEAIDTDVIRSVLQQHSSGIQVLSAPLDITQLVEFSPETWRNILSLLKQMGQFVVVDTSAYADAVLSEVLTFADEILVVCGPDILSMRSTMSLLETLRSERDSVRGKVQLILNRTGVRGGLDESTLQKQLREKIVVSLTDDAPLATYALNRGVPFVMSHGRSALTRSINQLVEQHVVNHPVAAPAAKKPFALLPLLSRG